MQKEKQKVRQGQTVFRGLKGRVTSVLKRESSNNKTFYIVKIRRDNREKISGLAFEAVEEGKMYIFDVRVTNNKDSSLPPNLTLTDLEIIKDEEE